MTVNSMGYHIRKKYIEDPLGGIADLRKGLIKPPNPNLALGLDFFRIFSIFKTSAKSSLKISHPLKSFIRKNADVIKAYLTYYRTLRTCHKFRKITDDDVNEYSIRAFKKLVQSTIADSFIPIENLTLFAYHKHEYRNLIFNIALISEFLIKYVEDPQFKMPEKQKHYIYNEIFYLAFQEKNKTIFFYDKFNNTAYPINLKNHKTILSSAKNYCEIMDCRSEMLKKINLIVLEEIVNKNIQIYSIDSTQ
jgi:tRNA nucleotidyltransferase/poly(A) polymerase